MSDEPYKGLFRGVFWGALIIIMCVWGNCRGCGASNENDQKESYKSFCEQNDFISAYKIVDEMKEEMQDYEGYHKRDIERGHNGWDDYMASAAKYDNLKQNYVEAEKYVVLHEAISILESQQSNGLGKIAVIVKEHNAPWLYKELVGIAILQNNEQLACTLVGLGKAASSEDLSNAITMKMTSLIDRIVEVDDSALENPDLMAYYRSQGDATYNAMIEKREKKREKEYTDRIEAEMKKLTAEKIDGIPRAEGVYDYFHSELYEYESDRTKEAKANLLYSQKVKEFNAKCMKLLDDAIVAGYLNSAKKIINIFRYNVEFVMISDKGVNYGKMKVSYTWTDKIIAQKKLNDAIRNGLFKK